MATPQSPSFFALLNPMAACASLWRQRGLIWQFTLRNVEMRHKGSILGLAWAVLNPLLMLGLYVFVFGYVFRGTFGVQEEESKISYGLGIFLGLAIFHLVSESIVTAPGVITNNPNFVKKVVFPLEILPVAAVGAAVVHLLITMVMIVIGLIIGQVGVTPSALLFPVILLPSVGYVLGLSWLIAALGVFFRDISQFVNAIATGLMFASAIFYSASRVQEIPAAWAILKFNPLIHTVEMSRDVLLWHRPISLENLGWLYVGGVVTALFGYAVFGRLKRAFADVI